MVDSVRSQGLTPPEPASNRAPMGSLSRQATADKAERIVKKILYKEQEWKYYDSGAVKECYIPLPSGNANPPETLLHIAKRDILGRKKRELMNEAQTMRKIQNTQTRKPEQKKYLATEHKQEKTDNSGRYALEVPFAEHKDFEEFLRKHDANLQTRLALLDHFFQGLDVLHDCGYAYGDIKPENCLVYNENGRPLLRIADFGKTTKLKAGEERVYRGNPRFMAPESKLSQKADVAAAALVMARCLEELLLDKKGTPLLKVETPDPNNKELVDKGKPKRRGIEAFICQHKAFAGVDGNLLVMLKRRFLARKADVHQRQTQTDLKCAYFRKITQTLVDQKKLTLDEAVKLNNLFAKMSATSPSSRYSAEQAKNEFQKIFSAIQNRLNSQQEQSK